MDRSDVIDLLKKGIVVVEFTKVNGEYRKMQCTLNELHLPLKMNEQEFTEKKKQNPEVLAVFDISQEGWRSFRWDKLQTVNGVIFDGAQ